MTSFKAAQDEILSSAPPNFTFTNPPTMGWWKAKFDLGLPAVAFVHHYQLIIGAGSRRRGTSDAYYDGNFTAHWQAVAGITPKQWRGVRTELSATGTLTFKIGAFGGMKGTWVRPSDQFLAVFGMTLNTYDVVAGLDHRIHWTLASARRQAMNPAAARPVSDEELGALGLWTARGGLARLYHAEHLGTLLDAHNAAKSPEYA